MEVAWIAATAFSPQIFESLRAEGTPLDPGRLPHTASLFVRCASACTILYCLPYAPSWVIITLAGTNIANGDDLCMVGLGDIGNGNGLLVDIQTDVECAKLVHS